MGHYLLLFRRKEIPLELLCMVVGTATKLALPLLISLTIDEAIRKADGRLMAQYVGALLHLYLLQWAANASESG